MKYHIVAKRITHRYKKFKGKGWREQFKNWLWPEWLTVLNKVSLKVKEGEIFALLGTNGAGKTTLIKILTGLIEASEGKAMLFGKPMPDSRDSLTHRFNVTFGGSNLYWYLSGWDNLLFFAKAYGLPNPKKKIEKLARFFDMEEKIRKPYHHYSSGERARINLAKGLLNDPEVLFVDEPTFGLDANFTRKVANLLKDLNDKGTTIFLTTHRMDIAEKLADRAAVIHKGKIIKCGTPHQLKESMKKKNVVKVRLRNPSLKIKKIIENQEFVKSVLMKKERMKVILSSFKYSNELIDVIRSAGGKIEEITTEVPSLEDVFLSLTGKELKK